MRIERVTAHAFGPLHEETLELADGMTVIVGANESAKSSWHAAIYAALCGRRRARGAPRKDEQRFADLHKPWDRDGWLVTAVVTLDDGRRVELRQDLAGRVDCHARDLELNRDISVEVMNDGAPDGARWLGLDRTSFPATACVEQAQLLHVLNDADGLQEHLQRAAASAGQEETAAAALDRLADFSKENVGTERANATKPLRRATMELEQATQQLACARSSHEEYLSRVADVDDAQHQAGRAADAVRLYEATAATQRAVDLAARAVRAVTLHDEYGDAPPAGTRAAAQAELDLLPETPAGDTNVHPSVAESLAQFRERRVALDTHRSQRPDVPETADPIAADDAELLT
ncbi:MAG: AAA family ATPase, partial [Trebonia sp.]